MPYKALYVHRQPKLSHEPQGVYIWDFPQDISKILNSNALSYSVHVLLVPGVIILLI